MNPEFRRNLWIELTTPRLLLAVLLPGVLILAAWLRPERDLVFINTLSLALYWISVAIWGTRRAAAAISGEVRGRTWESQVMSALSAWSMTWGKLLGGCSLIWMAGILCLASSFAVEVQVFPLETALLNAGLRVCIGFAAQAVALASALVILRKSTLGQSLNSTLSQTVGVLAGLFFSLLFAPITTHYDWLWTIALVQFIPGGIEIQWYGLDAVADDFRLASLAVFLGWTWLAANRLMRNVLQYSSLPWAWIAFVLFVIVYVAGFSTGPGSSTATWTATAFLVTAVLVYPAALSDVKDAVSYGWLRRDLMAGRWRQALQRLPAWLPTAIILLVLGIVVALTAPFSSWSLDQAPDMGQLVEMFATGSWLSTSLMLAILLFVVRDLGIIHMLAFSQAGRYSDVVAFLVLVVLYLVVPVAGTATGNIWLVAAFIPLDLNDPVTTLGPVAVEAVLATVGAAAMARRAARPAKPRAAAPQPAAA